MFRSLTVPGAFHVALAMLFSLNSGCNPSSSADKINTTENARAANQSVFQESPFQIIRRSKARESERTEPSEFLLSATNQDLSTSLLFTEVQEDVGLHHIFENGARGQLLAVETLGGGCGWLDYDMDGRIDIVCNQGGDATTLDQNRQPTDALFRNFGSAFERVDAQARIAETAYSQAVAVGDFDNDGFQDIYISNVFANTLWRNCGDGTFLEMAEISGVADKRWSSTSAWADIDKDGDLDLYVCNYLVYDPTRPARCLDEQGRVALCNPSKLEPWPDACYVNQGDGSFTEEARERGLVGPENRALSVAIADFNNDSWPDIYVANDTNDNFLFFNRGDGYFDEKAKLVGCATDYLGMPQSSMGLAVNDFDRNGFLDIYSTHYTNESNTLYANYGEHGFQDVTNRVGLHRPTLQFLGFGTVMQDFDHNGQMELFVGNGHVVTAMHEPDPRMQAQLFSYGGERLWRGVGDSSGDYFKKIWMARGVATADFEADGDLDILVLNLNDQACLLRNDSQRGQWLNVSFIGLQSNRYGVGVRVQLTTEEVTYVQEICGGTSFAASHQPMLSFGLGNFEGEVSLRVLWPSGAEQSIDHVSVGQHLIVREPATWQ